MKIYIRTRGSSIDYNFLLTKHPRLPDLNQYRSDFEQPTCILEQLEQDELYLFLSGIPSQRKDHQGTPLRYNLVITMKSGNGGDDGSDENAEKINNGLINLIWMWLGDVRKALQETQEEGSKRVRLPAVTESELGQLLDKTLTEKYVEKLLKLTVECTVDQKNELDRKQNELDRRLEGLILEISTAEQGQQPDYKYWWGGIDNDDSCKQWIKLVEKLLKGEAKEVKGKALLLNIATPKSLSRLLVEEEHLGVLLAKESYDSDPTQIERIDLSKPDDPTPASPIRKVVEGPTKFIELGIQFLKDPERTIDENMRGKKNNL